jgi:hypothetical protein
MRLNRRNFLSSLAGLASLATLPAGAANTTITYQRAFQRPPRQARPWVRWWWPGGVVDDNELRREIRLLNAAGFGGAEIQAFNPAIPDLTVQERARLNDYANTAYFEHLKVCTDEAQAQGLQIDTTFGSAWPSGGGFAITPELALIELTPAITSVQAPLTGPIQVKIPPNTRKFGAMSSLDARGKDPRVKDWRDRLAARQKIVAVVAIKSAAPELTDNKNFRKAVVKASGKMDTPKGIVLTDKLGPDGKLDWVPPSEGTWQIVVFKQFVVDSSVMAGVGEGPQLVLDHFKRAAFEAHARRVGDPMAPGGVPARALRATFVDSLELMPDMYWSEDLLAEFQARRGYDLTPFLPHLLQPGWMEAWNQHTSPPYFDAGDTGDRIRADYRQTLSELFIENFLQPFVEWNHQHGLQARLQAHGGPSDLLQSYGLADIPETEDLESGGDTHFMRLARAAANLYGRKLVGCESLCWPGKSFEITPAQWKARANLLIASGANALTMHGFPYALHKDAWPGWYPFAPSPFLAGFSSMISEANPLWNAIGELTGYIGRLQGVMQNSRNVVPVAVYLGEIGYFHGIEPASTTKLLENLLESGYDYDRINDDSILKGRVTGRTLRTSGGATYAALVLPARGNLPAATAAQLARFAKAGLPVVFVDHPPSHATGYADHERQDGLVREAVQSALDAGARIVPAATLQQSLREAGVPANLTFAGTSCLFIEKVLDGRSAYFLHNPKDQAISVRFTTRAKGFPELWDASNGTQAGLPFKHKDGATEIHLDIAAGGAALVVFTGKQAPPAMAWTPVDAIDLGRRQWTLDVQGHGHNGRPVNTRLMLDQLKDWSAIDGLADFSGQATYGTEITLPAAWLERGDRVWLELGAVHDMATVSVAGGPPQTLIAAPFDADITSLLRPGPNKLEIRVFNSPNNAMIDPKKAGLKNLKQQPAGLLGPVHLVRKQRKAGL